MNKLLVGLMSLALTACSNFEQKHQQVVANIAQSKSDFEQHLQNQNRLYYVDVIDGFYVPQLSSVEAFKPQWWFKQISQFNSNNMPLVDLMVVLENEYGIASQFAQDIPKDLSVDLIHKGTVGELIDRIARQTQLHFEFNQDVLSWQKFQNKLFDISFIVSGKEIPSKQNIASTNTMEEESSNALSNSLDNSSAAQGQQQNTISYEGSKARQGKVPDVWQDIEQSLKHLISPNGKYNLSQSSSTIMVYDHPQNVSVIGRYVQRLNHKLTQQIAIEVQIIEVKMNDKFEYGINWNIIRDVLSHRATLGLASQIQTELFTDASPNSLIFNVVSPSSRYSGSSALIKALEQQGQVSITTSPSTVTLNNQQAQITISEQTSYLASSSTNQSANVGSQTSLKPGVVTTGLSLKVLPLVAENEIILNIEGQLSSLTDIEVVESNGSVIQTPSVSGKHILQKVKVPVGHTLMLAGFKTSLNSSSDTGMLGQAWLNGTKQTKELVSEVIILVKPTLIY